MKESLLKKCMCKFIPFVLKMRKTDLMTAAFFFFFFVRLFKIYTVSTADILKTNPCLKFPSAYTCLHHLSFLFSIFSFYYGHILILITMDSEDVLQKSTHLNPTIFSLQNLHIFRSFFQTSTNKFDYSPIFRLLIHHMMHKHQLLHSSDAKVLPFYDYNVLKHNRV